MKDAHSSLSPLHSFTLLRLSTLPPKVSSHRATPQKRSAQATREHCVERFQNQTLSTRFTDPVHPCSHQLRHDRKDASRKPGKAVVSSHVGAAYLLVIAYARYRKQKITAQEMCGRTAIESRRSSHKGVSLPPSWLDPLPSQAVRVRPTIQLFVRLIRAGEPTFSHGSGRVFKPQNSTRDALVTGQN